MQWTGLNELREKFLHFFETKDHLRLPSFSLVPEGDKSLLLINSGMAPMKKYFTGEVEPPKKRVTTCQKCIRTPDIESVGITSRHGTYFEMLGNFSFADYFKKEAINWAWEFFVKELNLPKDLLYVTVYKEDDEAFDIWANDIGLPKEHIYKMGKEDNFWEHGIGPCGPCSEIFFDRGEKYGCGSPDCEVGCECDRFIEVWNLVFTQFYHDGEGNYTPLKNPNIDTGMGLERLACIMQDVDNLFEVDTVANIMNHIMKIAGVKYHENDKTDISLRIISDHIRSTTFMISDGVMPSNEGRGYVLRRLLRRAARHGKLLGVDTAFLAEVAETVIAENAKAYPNLEEKRDFILKIISIEEENFAKTIDSGLNLLNDMIKNAKSKVLSGDDVFKLSDTFGFPVDLTKEILSENNMTLDEKGFNELMQKQRTKARQARKDAGADAWKDSEGAIKGFEKTEFLGYDVLKSDAKIIGIVADGERLNTLDEGKEAYIILDKTPFYGESGGQVGDIGRLFNDSFDFDVENTAIFEDIIMHFGKLNKGFSLKIGDTITAEVNKDIREATMRNHTSAHLLQAALRHVLGKHIEQAGSYVSADVMRFDFTHFQALSSKEIAEVENFINKAILKAADVITKEMPINEAKALGAIALFGEKYGETVRLVQIEGISTELCGGTHVNNTGRLGLFKILTETSVAAGIRRIEGVTGGGVLDFIAKNNRVLHETAAEMKITNILDVPNRAKALVHEVKELEKELSELKSKMAASDAGKLIDKAKDVKGVLVLAENLGEIEVDVLRNIGDSLKSSEKSLIAVLAGTKDDKLTFSCVCTPEAVKMGANAGSIVREVAKITGGGGGGRKDSAMAGGKDKQKLNEALDAVNSIVENLIK